MPSIRCCTTMSMSMSMSMVMVMVRPHSRGVSPGHLLVASWYSSKPKVEVCWDYYWTGLRPATPTNIPYIGKSKVGKLWVNAGHGTIGWTHGAGTGKAIAELISGNKPEMQFRFLGT